MSSSEEKEFAKFNVLKEAELNAHKKWSREELSMLAPSELRAMLLESYKSELELSLTHREDVSFYASLYYMKVEWPHDRQLQISSFKRAADALLSTEPDYEYWARAAYWTVREACALLCGIDPDEIAKFRQIDELKKISVHPVISNFFKLLRLLGREVNEQDFKLYQPGNSQDLLAFGWVQLEINFIVDWAKRFEFEMPEKLKIAVERFHHFESPDKEDAESPSNFMKKISTYPEELRAAIEAFDHVSPRFSSESSGTPKKALSKWLEENKAQLSNEAKERIAVVANWKPRGGVAKTPTKKGG